MVETCGNVIYSIPLETWGCPQEAVSISIEEVEPSEWNRAVMETEVLPFEDRMMILEGKKRY